MKVPTSNLLPIIVIQWDIISTLANMEKFRNRTNTIEDNPVVIQNQNNVATLLSKLIEQLMGANEGGISVKHVILISKILKAAHQFQDARSSWFMPKEGREKTEKIDCPRGFLRGGKMNQLVTRNTKTYIEGFLYNCAAACNKDKKCKYVSYTMDVFVGLWGEFKKEWENIWRKIGKIFGGKLGGKICNHFYDEFAKVPYSNQNTSLGNITHTCVKAPDKIIRLGNCAPRMRVRAWGEYREHSKKRRNPELGTITECSTKPHINILVYAKVTWDNGTSESYTALNEEPLKLYLVTELPILGCCLTVTITSNGPVAQHQGDKLGIFKFWQVKENNVEYENKNQRSPRFLHRQNSKNLWTVSKHDRIGRGDFLGGIHHPTCNASCPMSCDTNWKFWNDTNKTWGNDATVNVACNERLDCKGGYFVQIADKDALVQDGWEVHVDHSNGDDSNSVAHENNCSMDTFYGYKNGASVGSVAKRFEQSGKGMLFYGNCFKTGYVSVFLNGVQLSRSLSNTQGWLTFYYSKDDRLTIEEYGKAIIKLYYVVLEDCDVYENHCKFVVGKGKGGITKRLKIGKTDTDTECAQLVRNLEPSANGATWRRGNRNCYAEFGATTQDDNHKYQTCLFKDKYVLIPKTTPRWLADSCEYETGDGAGIRDELIGKTTSAEDCAAVVIEQRPLANGATWGPDVDEESARKCYAEFGATTRGNTSDCPSCRSCIFEHYSSLWSGTFEHKNLTTGQTISTTVKCDGRMLWDNRGFNATHVKKTEVPPSDPHYQGWHFQTFRGKQAWEYFRFTSQGKLEVHHFCTDNAARSSLSKPGPPTRQDGTPYTCNNISDLNSPNYCCKSVSDGGTYLCL